MSETRSWDIGGQSYTLTYEQQADETWRVSCGEHEASGPKDKAEIEVLEQIGRSVGANPFGWRVTPIGRSPIIRNDVT